jgi:demethylmenaquinone methyltransferase/2-methoxy-6-polyprenyl-1,4-benzoquinol methylase
MADVPKALAEFARVLASGGRCAILEFHSSRPRGLGRLARWYTDRVMPVLASWIARDGVGAYRYLRSSSETFGPPEDLSRRLFEAGFARATFTPVAMGLAAVHVASKA